MSSEAKQLIEKLNAFRQKASDADNISLVFATTEPISTEIRHSLEQIRTLGREQGLPNFNVADVSLKTLWDELSVEPSPLSVPIRGQFVEQASGLLVGTVALPDLFAFLKAYESRSGNIDKLYEKNVRLFLGKGKPINRGIEKTLRDTPDKFGLYNNGITIVVSNYQRDPSDEVAKVLNDPYVVNGCQTTRTIWWVLDSRLNTGGTGQAPDFADWRERLGRGGVVTKIVKSDEAEIGDITRFTNSQNSIKDQDFLALTTGFQAWAQSMADDYQIFLELQRGGIDARKAYEKQHPDTPRFKAYANAFDLLKAYGAGWMAVPGVAFNKNAAFLPGGSNYEKMMDRSEQDPFGVKDLYAAYLLKAEADKLEFGRKRKTDQQSRRLSRFLFYYVVMRFLVVLIGMKSEIKLDPSSPVDLTDTVLLLAKAEAHEGSNSCLEVICKTAAGVIDSYVNVDGENSLYDEESFAKTHDRDVNSFLKAEALGTEEHSPLLRKTIGIHAAGFAHFGPIDEIVAALA